MLISRIIMIQKRWHDASSGAAYSFACTLVRAHSKHSLSHHRIWP
jgi:hypothetical protein